MDRRQYLDDTKMVQELQTFELFPDRWRKLHVGEAEAVVDGEVYEGVQDTRDIDAWLATYGDEVHMPREMGAEDLAYYGMEV